MLRQELYKNWTRCIKWFLNGTLKTTLISMMWTLSFFNNGGRLTWTHCNALSIGYRWEHFLVSSRDFCEITKINHANGSIMWRWGGHRNEFKFVNCPVPFYGQHNIRRIANGHFTLYDNGDYIVPHGARAMEFDLNETNKISHIKVELYLRCRYDQQRARKYATAGQRKYPGKLRQKFLRFGLFCNSGFNRGSKVFELDGFGKHLQSSLTCHRIPWQLRRPQITRKDSAGITRLEAEKGHAHYYWSNGSTERTIPGNQYRYLLCASALR